MNQFHPELFTLGPCEERIFKTPVTKLAVLDDFWSDFEAVQEQLEILAYAHTAYSDTDMEDFRFGWDKTIKGHDMPYVDELSSKVSRIFDIPGFGVNQELSAQFAVNCNRVLSDRIKDDFYNPHFDVGSFSVVVFMNNEYKDNDGFNIYNPPSVSLEKRHWFTRDELKVDTFVRGKANRAVLFPVPKVFHGMEIRSEDFREDYRCTSVIFLGN